jgi:hypothetical protein
LTPVQIVQLKQPIKTRNEENTRLDAAHKVANTKAKNRYGIRNDRVVKVYLNQDKNSKMLFYSFFFHLCIFITIL